MTQPNPWKNNGTIAPSADSTFGGSGPDDKEEAAIAEAVERVRAALADARSSNADRPALLFLGVGVGNPMGAWQHPSGSPRFDADAKQVSPPLIQDAIANGYFVIGLNFNTSDTAQPAELSVQHGIHLHVPARFPLQTMTGAPTGVLAKLRALAEECDRVVVLNAVTNHLYQPLIMLAAVHSSNQKISAAGRIRSVYAMSYAESGEQIVIAMIMNGKMSFMKKTGLTSMAAVFPSPEELPD